MVDFKEQETSKVVLNRWFSSNKLFDQVDEQADLAGMVQDIDGDLVPSMPKTDKELRKERRKAAVERKERRADKKRQQEEEELGSEAVNDMEFVAVNAENLMINDKNQDDKVDSKTQLLNDKKKELIRAGMGASVDAVDTSAYQVAPREIEEPVLTRVDDRLYDSDHEEYDGEDRAKTLALAHLMLRRHKAKELIDSSYNRYAWNDKGDLPSWFQDDEEKHYRPQIPIPKHLMDQMKQRFMEMASKPVKKVAEARARKKRQEMKKVKSAKKKANEIANLPDMSTREKVKAIDKAMKNAKMKKESKIYVVSRRDGKSTSKNQKGQKGKIKLVDPRMKKDKRALENKMKNKKKKKKHK